VGPHSLFVGGGGPSLSVGARCLQARVGLFSSVGGCCVCGWASRWGSFSSVGGCCVHGWHSRSGVGVAFGVVLVSGGLLHPWALAFEGGHRVWGRSRRWGVVMGGFRRRGGFSFSSSGCRLWAVVLCGWGTVVGCPILSGSFWFSLTIVVSRRHCARFGW
jgi:hypothetical protein